MLYKRTILSTLHRWLGGKEVIVLLGSRQVGKTSLLKLIQNEIDEGATFYFDLENTFDLTQCETVEKFINHLTIYGLDKNKRNLCFLDEIQYHPDPSKFLKLLHDHHPYLKLIVTGSSSFEIRRRFRDSLVGRRITFRLYPLSFLEYLRFRDSEYEQLKSSLNLFTALADFETARKHHIMTPKLLAPFETFMVLGGYPGVVLKRELADKQDLLQEIISTYVQRDIKDLARIPDPLKFNKLITYLAVQNANLFRVQDAAREVGINQRTLNNYLFMLENTFILSLLRPFTGNIQKELTKMPKLHFLDTGLRNSLINDMRGLNLRPDLGALAENCCYTELLKQSTRLQQLHYWRTADGKEIDFVITDEQKRILPIEVKYQNKIKGDVPQPMKFFISRYKPAHAVIVTKNTCEQIRFNSTTVTFLPMWMI